MKEVIKKHRLEIIIVSALLAIFILTSLVVSLVNLGATNYATCYLNNEPLWTINLKEESEERTFPLSNNYPQIIVGVKNNQIAILKNDCPHQDCVHQGYVSSQATPIICVYYHISIVLEEESDVDLIIK